MERPGARPAPASAGQRPRAPPCQPGFRIVPEPAAPTPVLGVLNDCTVTARMLGKPVYVLNGPNLNLLGVREPQVYGHETLADVRRRAEAAAARVGLTVDFRQSNHEGQLIDWVHEARDKGAGLIVNAGGLTHTSIALLDALQAADLPVIEVHLSNIFRREAFRHHSYVSLAARGVICGLGGKGYELAVEAIADVLASGAGRGPASAAGRAAS